MAMKNFLYLDCETTGFDASSSEITMIAYASFKITSEGSIEMLYSLKQLNSWENPDGEKGIIQDFFKKTRLSEIWEDAPVGFNLPFDVNMLIKRAEFHKIQNNLNFEAIFNNKQRIDLRVIGVLMFRGSFFGSGLNNICGKQGTGKDAVMYYNTKQFQKLKDYNHQEYIEFMKFLNFLLKKMPLLLDDFKKNKW